MLSRQGSFLSSLLPHTAEKPKPLCQAGRIDLWPQRFYRKTLFFSFFPFVCLNLARLCVVFLAHESTATGLFFFVAFFSTAPL